MLNFKIFGFGAMATCLLAACATVEGYEQMLNTYIGKSSDQLVREFGVPNRSIELKAGGEVFEYDRRRLTSTPGTCFDYDHAHFDDYFYDRRGRRHHVARVHHPFDTCSSPEVEERVCVTRFFMDEDNIVEDWAHEGDDCLAVPVS